MTAVSDVYWSVETNLVEFNISKQQYTNGIKNLAKIVKTVYLQWHTFLLIADED